MGLLLFYLPGIAWRRTAKKQFSSHFPDDSAELWLSTRAWRTRLAPSRPRHTSSVNLMMRHMEWGGALYRAVQEHGMSQAEAGSMVESIVADIYQPVPATMFRLSRLRSSDHATRVEWLLLRVITRHFFTAPFIHRYLDVEDAVAYDVTRCPFADYFEEQGIPELTPHAACNADYRAADEFGAFLIRTQTIADGAGHCDFRWKTPA